MTKNKKINSKYLKSPSEAYLYALRKLKGPFPLGEPIIAINAEYSCLYARDVLHESFELGEKL